MSNLVWTMSAAETAQVVKHYIKRDAEIVFRDSGEIVLSLVPDLSAIPGGALIGKRKMDIKISQLSIAKSASNIIAMCEVELPRIKIAVMTVDLNAVVLPYIEKYIASSLPLWQGRLKAQPGNGNLLLSADVTSELQAKEYAGMSIAERLVTADVMISEAAAKIEVVLA